MLTCKNSNFVGEVVPDNTVQANKTNKISIRHKSIGKQSALLLRPL